jgi:hypothetical protein
MDEPHLPDELADLHRFLKRLETNELTLRRGNFNVTEMKSVS